MAALVIITLTSVMLLAVFRRNGDGVTIYDESVGRSCCGGVLLAPEFKPKLSVLLNIIVVGRTKILQLNCVGKWVVVGLSASWTVE